MRKKLTGVGREGIELANKGTIKLPVNPLSVTENTERTEGGGPRQ